MLECTEPYSITSEQDNNFTVGWGVGKINVIIGNMNRNSDNKFCYLNDLGSTQGNLFF